MYYTIYKTINLINSKIYIGMHVTDNPNDEYLGSGKVLQQAVRKYGKENFKKEILFVFDNEQEMKDKEKEIVTEEFCLRDDTYNLCNGGKGGFGYINRSGIVKFKGRTHSAETREKISSKMSGRKYPERKVILSEDTKRKIGESTRKRLKGKPKTPEHREKIRAAIMRRTQTLSTELSADALKRKQESMAIARSHKPESPSEKTRSRISESLKKAYKIGKRSRPTRDWESIQYDLDAGVRRTDIYVKHGINKNVLDHAFKMQYIVRYK
jgi:hypothetical protein